MRVDAVAPSLKVTVVDMDITLDVSPISSFIFVSLLSLSRFYCYEAWLAMDGGHGRRCADGLGVLIVIPYVAFLVSL
jgi:hypothetical protein